MLRKQYAVRENIQGSFMKRTAFKGCISVASIATIGMGTMSGIAQGAEEETTALDEIVVTVVAELVRDFKPSSEAEVFRMIPGIQVAGTAGPGGNSNIAVRGLPVATGGSPFVQIQEDGLPTVLFGDIQFGNNDYWTRFDSTVASIEGVRGGSASTYASQAPGAVINYISHTGRTEGGFLALNRGVGYDETKVDFRYGGSLNDTTHYHVGGFFKKGRGPLHADYTVSDSVQIKGNITKDIADGNGYFRLLFKFADTQEPNYTGAPGLAHISGNSVSGIEPYPGFDGRDTSNYSIHNQDFLIVNRDNVLQRVRMDGITTKARSIGSQFHYAFNDSITVDNNMRWTNMSGGFASPFLNVARTSSVLGSTVNGSPVATIRYANGPRAGQVYTSTYLNNNTNVRTNIRDIGSFANDLAVASKWDSAAGVFTARAGLFYMNQSIAMDWHTNKAYSELSGDNPAMLNLFNAAGARLTADGIAGFNNNWGDCCARDYDLSYADNAPYVALDFDGEHFGLDGSVRFDGIKASGTGQAGGAEYNTNVNGVLIPTITDNGVRESLNYTRRYTSWSLGGLYKLNTDTSLFLRTSKGGRFNGDRQTFSGKFNADGSLNQVGKTASVDFVTQNELGVKNRGSLLGGTYTAELTLLKGHFKQSTYELSATRCPGGAGGCVIDARYKSTGAEFYGTYNTGGFSLVANATFSNAKKAGSGSNTFVRADGIPDLVYTLSSNYKFNDSISAGLNATGQSNAIDGANNKYPGSTTFGAVVRYRPIEKLELGLQVYNLFDKFDLRGNGGIADSSVNPTVIGGAPTIGRTVTASIRYDF
jgi:outer membrane receptor protein involved in Fe transport